jgi:branched-chain amino acid transport system substrate-binding protein
MSIRGRTEKSRRRGRFGITSSLALALALVFAIPARAADTIKIGESEHLTGALAPSAKADMLAQQIWVEEVNKRGGLLGRKVELVVYDDQSNPALVPGIYTKLIEIDNVDLLIGSGAQFIVATMPIVMAKKRTLISLMTLAANDHFHYPQYFATGPFGSPQKAELSHAYFEVVKQLKPQPATLAVVAADAEFTTNMVAGARFFAKENNLRIVYDKTYPLGTVDYAPIIRAIQAAKPDVVFVASYPLDSIGLVRAAREANLKTRLFGGGMVGPQYASTMAQLGEALENLVFFHFYVPEPTMEFAGISEFLAKYHARARDAGVDQLGFYQPPYSYAAMQILEQAITATGSLADATLAEYMHGHSFKTIVGDIAFDADGEWATPRVLMVQFQNLKGNGLEQFMQTGKEVILSPPAYKSGELRSPFEK